MKKLRPSVYGYVYMSSGALGVQRQQISAELELQAVVNAGHAEQATHFLDFTTFWGSDFYLFLTIAEMREVECQSS